MAGTLDSTVPLCWRWRHRRQKMAGGAMDDGRVPASKHAAQSRRSAAVVAQQDWHSGSLRGALGARRIAVVELGCAERCGLSTALSVPGLAVKSTPLVGPC